MIRKIRLKWQLAAIFLALGVLLVVGYSMLAAHYFMLGMDSFLVGSMEHAVQRYETDAKRGLTRPEIEGFTITKRWADQPSAVQSAFGQPPEPARTLLKARVEHIEGKQHGRLYFAMRFPEADGDLFITHEVSRKSASDLVVGIVHDNLNSLLTISIGSALALLLILWLVLRRVSKPVGQLGQWARDLDTTTLREPVPDFRYPELNELAGLVRSSLSSLEESLEREHRFLRHTSHELRTPISVIRNNVELIRSLPPETGPASDSALGPIIDRVDRASLTMKHLTETLLWLSRDEPENLPTRTLSLDTLIRELVSEHRYLLRDKDVTLTVETESAALDLPHVAARVVLGNLIRNAFQHTWAGEVSIRQQGDTVHIDNHQASDEDANDDLGFGLGLQLTAQLTERLGWSYRNDPAPGGHRVTLRLGAVGTG